MIRVIQQSHHEGQLKTFMGCMGKGTVSVSLVLHMCANLMDVWQMPM